jgi:hypothetical protein
MPRPKLDPTALGHFYPLTKTTLLDELRSARELLDRWVKLVESVRDDEPMDEEEVRTMLQALPGEMVLLSAKAQGMAQAISMSGEP